MTTTIETVEVAIQATHTALLDQELSSETEGEPYKREFDPSLRSTALGRWVGLGPYYAMFPSAFAFDVVRTYSKHEQTVLDPFAGRATAIYAATVLGRGGMGIEINPLGWLYGKVKLAPASLDNVLAALQRVDKASEDVKDNELAKLPEFFHACYTTKVLRFLVAGISHLDWKSNQADATLMAILMVYLHGAREKSLSNQMRQGKALSPAYAVKWWKDHNSTPPDRDPLTFLEDKIRWRYMKGLPAQADGRIILGDSLTQLLLINGQINLGELQPFDLLFTSPPYSGVTDYHYDQWLRLWMLGGPPEAVHYNIANRDDFANQVAYSKMLHRVFAGCSKVMADNASIYVRTDARKFTFDTTVSALQEAFPNKSMQIIPRPFSRSTQTALFGDKAPKPGEKDIVMTSCSR